MPHAKLTAIATVDTKGKGEIFKAILERHGFLVFLSPNDKVRVLGDAAANGQPYDVMVPDKYADQALDLLQTLKTQEIGQKEADFDIAVVTCKSCNGRVLIKKSLAAGLTKCPKCLADL